MKFLTAILIFAIKTVIIGMLVTWLWNGGVADYFDLPELTLGMGVRLSVIVGMASDIYRISIND